MGKKFDRKLNTLSRISAFLNNDQKRSSNLDVFCDNVIKQSSLKVIKHSIIQDFRATSGIFKKGHFLCSFIQKYLKVTLLLAKGAPF